MCRGAAEGRVWECVARATGLVEVAEVEGIACPLVFHCTGQKVRMYLPAGWTGPARDWAVCGLFAEVLRRSGALGVEECVGVWRDLLGRVVGPVGAAVGGLAACLALALLLGC